MANLRFFLITICVIIAAVATYYYRSSGSSTDIKKADFAFNGDSLKEIAIKTNDQTTVLKKLSNNQWLHDASENSFIASEQSILQLIGSVVGAKIIREIDATTGDFKNYGFDSTTSSAELVFTFDNNKITKYNYGLNNQSSATTGRFLQIDNAKVYLVDKNPEITKQWDSKQILTWPKESISEANYEINNKKTKIVAAKDATGGYLVNDVTIDSIKDNNIRDKAIDILYQPGNLTYEEFKNLNYSGKAIFTINYKNNSGEKLEIKYFKDTIPKYVFGKDKYFIKLKIIDPVDNGNVKMAELLENKLFLISSNAISRLVVDK